VVAAAIAGTGIGDHAPCAALHRLIISIGGMRTVVASEIAAAIASWSVTLTSICFHKNVGVRGCGVYM
jgi:hypothetical protein